MGDVAQILGFTKAGPADPGEALLGSFRRRGGASGAGDDLPAAKKKSTSRLSRELSALVGDQAQELLPTVAPSRQPLMAGRKARPGSRVARRWVWKPFTSSARKDGAVLSHWVRTDTEFTDYPFARFNKRADVLKYSDTDYGALFVPTEARKAEALAAALEASPTRTPGGGADGSLPGSDYDMDRRWPKEHTDLLFDLARRFDLRWPVIADRLDVSPPHTIEDCKTRYYNVCARLTAMRLAIATDDATRNNLRAAEAAYSNNAHRMEWEQRRRRQLDGAFRRSNEALQQEREVLRELKAVEMQIRKVTGKAAAAAGKASGGAVVKAEPKSESSSGAAAAAASEPPAVASAAALAPVFPNAVALTVKNLAHHGAEPVALPVASPIDVDGSLLSSSATTGGSAPLVPAVGPAARRGGQGGGGQGGVGAARSSGVAGVGSGGGAAAGGGAGVSAGNPNPYGAPVRSAFVGVALRSAQLSAPLEGLAPESKTLAKVNALLREAGVPDVPLPSPQVLVALTQLRREALDLVALGRAVEEAEVEVMKAHSFRREVAVRPPPQNTGNGGSGGGGGGRPAQPQQQAQAAQQLPGAGAAEEAHFRGAAAAPAARSFVPAQQQPPQQAVQARPTAVGVGQVPPGVAMRASPDGAAAAAAAAVPKPAQPPPGTFAPIPTQQPMPPAVASSSAMQPGGVGGMQAPAAPVARPPQVPAAVASLPPPLPSPTPVVSIPDAPAAAAAAAGLDSAPTPGGGVKRKGGETAEPAPAAKKSKK